MSSSPWNYIYRDVSITIGQRSVAKRFPQQWATRVLLARFSDHWHGRRLSINHRSVSPSG